MSKPVSTIRNLGPASEASFPRAGIGSAEELREIGADTAYARLLKAGSRPHFIGYYALVMGLQGRPWNDCKGREKAELRNRFERICAAAPPPSIQGLPAELSRFLDTYGLREG